jgi:hypothetical protein
MIGGDIAARRRSNGSIGVTAKVNARVVRLHDHRPAAAIVEVARISASNRAGTSYLQGSRY